MAPAGRPSARPPRRARGVVVFAAPPRRAAMKTANRLATALMVALACLAALAVAQNVQQRSSAQAAPMTLVSPPDDPTRIVQARMHAKNRVVERLLVGELSLVEAAAWFRFLNDNPPDHRSDF